MSEILKAKQRLLQKSITIMEAPEQDSQFKIFTRTGNASSIPKLHAKNKKPIERSISEIQIQDNDLNFQNQVKRFSPKFAKTERTNLLKPNVMYYEKFEMMSQKAQSINLFGRRKQSNRRVTQYSQYGLESIGGDDMSFTDNNQSVYNQSPIKTIKNNVHGEKLNIIITKVPTRKALSPVKPKQCEIDYVSELARQQKSKNSLFTDSMFPPKFTIIFNKKYMYLQEGLKIQRLSKIYEGNQQLRLIKFCEPTLMNPGKFTSPALYSALVILSQDPTRVLNLFGNQQFNNNGIYYVQICKDGVWRYIIIDDYLPVRILAKRSLLFLHTIPKNGFIQFWPCILEKAVAKMYGTYQDIYLTADRGVKDIFRSLTGLPCSQYTINKDFRTFLIIIDTAVKKKQITVLESVPEQFRETAHVKGIQWDQSYQIIQVKKTYIVLRNVADKDLITKLSFQQAMLFSKLLIFRSQNNYAYISRTLRHKHRCYSIVRVTLKSSLKCYWDVWENSEVYYKNHIGSHIEYSKSKYSIQIKKQQSQQQTYDSKLQDDIITESGKQIAMNPGTYQISVHLCQKKQLDFTLSYYGEQEIDIVRVKNMEKWPLQCDCS